MRLYELVPEVRQVFQTIEESEGELTPAVESELNVLFANVQDKLDSIAKLISEHKAHADVLKVEIKRLATKMDSHVQHANWLRQYAEDCMRELGMNKLKTHTHTLSFQKTPPRVVLHCDESEVPEEFTKIERRVQKKRIAEALKAGDPIEFAHLEQDEKLRIR